MFSTSRTGIDIFSDQLIHAVQSGEVNPLKIRIWIKTVEEILERVKKETNEHQLREAGKYSEDTFDYAGAKITKAELGTKYDYSVCGDPVHKHLSDIVESAKEQLSEREAFLKALREPLVMVDEGSGEVTRVIPPLKKSTTGLKVSIK
jgi:hypothetical protein